MVDNFKKLEVKDVKDKRIKKLTEDEIKALGKFVGEYNKLVDKVKKEETKKEEKLKILQDAYDTIWNNFRHCVSFK